MKQRTRHNGVARTSRWFQGFGAALVVIALAGSTAPAQAEHLYTQSRGIYRINVDLTQGDAAPAGLKQYQLERVPLSVSQMQDALAQRGIQGITVTQPRYMAGGMLLQRSKTTDTFPDIEGRGAPFFAPYDPQRFGSSLEAVTGLLDAIKWPRPELPITAMTVHDLAQQYQDRFGPGVLMAIDDILTMKFATQSAEGKTFVTFQSTVDGYPLAEHIKSGRAYSAGGRETAGTLANVLLGPDDQLLCAFVPFPFTISAQQDLQAAARAWQDAVPAIMDRQMAMYDAALASNRAVLPAFDAVWAQNNTSIHLRVKGVELVYVVHEEGANLLALPAWQVCVEADFVYTGNNPKEAVRAAMPDVEDHIYYVDVQTGQITQ